MPLYHKLPKCLLEQTLWHNKWSSGNIQLTVSELCSCVKAAQVPARTGLVVMQKTKKLENQLKS